MKKITLLFLFFALVPSFSRAGFLTGFVVGQMTASNHCEQVQSDLNHERQVSEDLRAQLLKSEKMVLHLQEKVGYLKSQLSKAGNSPAK